MPTHNFQKKYTMEQLMQPTSENWSETLLGEMLVCSLIGRALYAYPDKVWLQSLLEEDVFSETPFGAGQAEIDSGMFLLQRWSDENRTGLTNQAFDAIESDYMHLFIGPKKVLAPLWESYYLNKDHLLFQVETLQVRNWYQRFGLQAENLYHEPDDHIGIEFSFIAHLAKQGLQACEADDTKKLKRMLKAQGEFIRTHPQRWIKAWQQNVEDNARTDFYLGISRLALGVIGTLEPILMVTTGKEANKSDIAPILA